MRENSLEASVHYGDYRGTAAADGHDQMGLMKLAGKYGVDTDKYFVIGVNIYIGETHGNKLGRARVVVLAVDSSLTGDSIDSVQEYVDEHEGSLQYEQFSIDAKLEEALLAFKRFDVVLVNRVLKRIKECTLAPE